MLKYHHSAWNPWDASSAGSTNGGNPNGGVAVGVGGGVGVSAAAQAESKKPTNVVVKMRNAETRKCMKGLTLTARCVLSMGYDREPSLGC
jgi:hypothetical protein